MHLSSASFGHFNLYTIETGLFRIDGGAMFGVVPKTLWKRHAKPDDDNRILLSARCLLVISRETGRRYLIDTGNGHKFDQKFSRIYGLDFSKNTLLKSLDYHGFTTSDITDVIFTHMHFDHCGGAVQNNSDGKPELVFPQAKHWVHKAQWANVLNPNEREKSSFLPENIEPLAASGLLFEVDDEHIYEPGLEIIVANGHTAGQQLPILRDEKRTILFAADLVPTTAHLPLSWVMGFDTRPLQTMREKKSILSECLKNETLLYLEHDPSFELIRLEGTDKRTRAAWSGTLDDL